MEEEWISLTAYMKRFHTGFKEVKNKLEYFTRGRKL